ncbi:MAG: PAS domain S-box protein [Microthrixaceae bacterium]|nr:PAS domain S-box protein [Microthrixaceae bacterium]
MDEGGDPACWAHLNDEPIEVPSQQALARLLIDLSDAVVICDADRRITFWNSAAERLFGWEANRVMGDSVDIIIPEQLRNRHRDQFFAEIRGEDQSIGRSIVHTSGLHRDGSCIPLEISLSALRSDRALRPLGIAAVIRLSNEERS